MIGNIEVNPAELRAMADQIDKCRNDMEECLAEINDVMETNVREGWRDRAGARLMDRFQSLRSRYFSNYPQSMQDYSAYLRKTADDYEETERRRKQDVENQGNMGV